PRWGCYRCGKKGHVAVDCRTKMFERCNGRGRTADVCPTAKEEAAKETGECGDVGSGMGEGESACQVGDEAWSCDSGASTHMTPSVDCMSNYREGNL
ncbi:unnamed protein product, partial [Laminaria digitata]